MNTLDKAVRLAALSASTKVIPGTMCKCGGAMFNVTGRLAQATGVVHTRCDGCGRKEATRVVQDAPKLEWYE